MGQLVCRLAARDLRLRPTEAVLMLLAIAAATTSAPASRWPRCYEPISPSG